MEIDVSLIEKDDVAMTPPWGFVIGPKCGAAIVTLECLWLLAFSGLAGKAQELPKDRPVGRLIASSEPGWPQWRGPRRDGICDETGLLQEWPSGGPRSLWKSGDLGRGFSAPIISSGRIYLTGDVGDELRVYALDLEGKQVWQSKNGEAWNGPYPGARACCTLREGRLYNMNAHGRVACLEAASGKEIWAVNMLERFAGKEITWGIADCLLVDGPRVIVTPGGTKALMAALDKRTGETLWTTDPLRLGPSGDPSQERLPEPAGEVESTSYGSPSLFELEGRRTIVRSSLRHIFGVDADTGKLLWTRPMRTSYSVIAATPVVIEDAVFCTAPDTEGGKLFRIVDHGRNVETAWTTPLDTCHGCLIYRNGMLYGSWYRKDKGWACVDARTGQVRYQTKEMAMGSILYADQRLYCLGQDGQMALIKPTPDHFEFTGRFRLVNARANDAWTHPVIFDGRLYLRYHETLYCYDIRKQ